ncbi:MAG TPA: UbiA family prenyltransferase [Pilimelia sp.]|nr:UbiA family prenyltransferase [Pilimelia sp.]
MRRRGWALLRASHPEPAAAVTTLSGVLAVGGGHPPASAALVVGAVAASQLAIGWVNDAVDARRDAAVGRADKPVAAGRLSARAAYAAGALAAVACGALSLATGLVPGLVMIAALVSALAYDWPLKGTPASVLPYAFSFGALPAFVVLAGPGRPWPPAWLVAAGALLGAGAHFANALPDLADDARTGVRGLPQRLGRTRSRAAGGALLAAATAVLIAGPAGPPAWWGWATLAGAGAVLAWGAHADRRAARAGNRTIYTFRAVMIVAVLDVALLVAGARDTGQGPAPGVDLGHLG